MRRETQSAEHTLAQSYNTTPYVGNPYYHTHPGVLAAYGVLYGLSPSDPHHSRVLELGCGDAANLIPMAHEFPSGEFVGIDLSSVQIGIGQKKAETLGLTNIELKTRSILDIGAADGKFDYIIAHGVYSWVTDTVREKILDICRENLSDQGIAYISYNVLPGWRFNQSMRDLILYRTRKIKDPEQRVAAVLNLINTMLGGVASGKSAHDVQLRSFAKTLKGIPDVSTYLLHEYMEKNNHPYYFHEFVDELHPFGLQYVCDADQDKFELDALPPETAADFESIGENAVEVEQYIDFLRNTRFRRSLVCHAGIQVDSAYRLERIQDLHAATDIVPDTDTPDPSTREPVAYKTPSGRRFSTQHQSAQEILRLLNEIRPCSIPVGSLIEAVAGEGASGKVPDDRETAEKIGHALYSLFFNGVVDLLGTGRRCVLDTGEFPKVSPVSRLLIQSYRVTNLCHQTIVMEGDDLAVFVLTHLDGTRNRDDLCDLMTEAVRNGRVSIPGLKVKGGDEIRRVMRDRLGSILQQIPRYGILIQN